MITRSKITNGTFQKLPVVSTNNFSAVFSQKSLQNLLFLNDTKQAKGTKFHNIFSEVFSHYFGDFFKAMFWHQILREAYQAGPIYKKKNFKYLLAHPF